MPLQLCLVPGIPSSWDMGTLLEKPNSLGNVKTRRDQRPQLLADSTLSPVHREGVPRDLLCVLCFVFLLVALIWVSILTLFFIFLSTSKGM